MRKLAIWFRAHPLTSAFLALVALAVGGHFFANWRADAAWEKYCVEARGRGVILTIQEWVPPEVPNAKNFAALPMMRAAVGRTGIVPFKLPRPAGVARPSYSTYKGERLDLGAWASFFLAAKYLTETTDSPPRDVLQALETYAPQFKEWSERRQRPFCHIPLELDSNGSFLKFNSSLQSNALEIFSLRMRAHLAAGDSPSALADFEDALQCYRLDDPPRGLISAILRAGVILTLSTQVGESLQESMWADAELRKLDAILATLRPMDSFKQALSMERISNNQMYDRLARQREERQTLAAIMPRVAGSAWGDTACMLIPARVFRENQLRHNQYYDEILVKLAASNDRLDSILDLSSAPEKLTGFLDEYYFCVFKLFGYTARSAYEHHLSMQSRIDQTRLAIALELFRRANGAFPEKLDELVPDFMTIIPSDVQSAQPIYRRTAGGYLLYGIGRDGKDDGGDLKKDSVWRHAPSATSAK
jgi:tetratricopeptide (TPR) repeat protein